jgi:hypothetical protein
VLCQQTDVHLLGFAVNATLPALLPLLPPALLLLLLLL